MGLTCTRRPKLYYFRDDPAACGDSDLEDDQGSSNLTVELREGQDDPLDPKLFCSCGHCTMMPTKAESFCCKSVNYLQSGGKHNSNNIYKILIFR